MISLPMVGDEGLNMREYTGFSQGADAMNPLSNHCIRIHGPCIVL